MNHEPTFLNKAPARKEREENSVDPKFRRRSEVSGGRNVSASIEGKFESSASRYLPPFRSSPNRE